MKTQIVQPELTTYQSEYTERGFWGKLGRTARKAGRKLVKVLLVLYYVARDPAVPLREKAKIYGALGYFILPADLVPDPVLGFGFADDLSAALWAFYSVRKYVTPQIEAQAEQRLNKLGL